MQSDEFDRDMFLLNCKNGTLDLRTGDLKPHGRDDYITRRVELEYKPEVECPELQKFLEGIFLNDQEIIGFMQKAIGYALSGSMKEQCVFIV